MSTIVDSRADTSQTTAQDVIDRVTELVPTLRENARQTELQRRIPADTLDLLKDAGVFRLALPRRFGGIQASPNDIALVHSELGRADPSLAWVTTIFTSGSYFVGLLPDDAAAEIADADEQPRISGLLAPTGQAIPDDDGVTLSGKWMWNTGGVDSTWVGLSAIEMTARGPAPIFCLVPTSEVTLEDTWHASGMSGTATNLITASEVHVPRRRILNIADFGTGSYSTENRAFADDPYYKAPVVQTFAFMVAPTLVGFARGALDVFLPRTANAITYTNYSHAADAPVVQHAVAKATYDIEIAEMYVGRLAGQVEQSATRTPTVLERIQTRAWLGQVARYSRSAVNALWEVSGASVIQHSQPLQRYFRDINSVSLHAAVQPLSSDELYGRVLLGLEPNSTFF